MNQVKEIKYGKVSGIYRQGCHQYLGIPYAKPPVEEEAFKHPQEPESWEGVYDASYGRANPVQSTNELGISYMGQDCLYMNVFVPDTQGDALPVMVWIYGGAYATGGTGAKDFGSEDLCFDMAKYARETGTLVVSFNYRLNLYGFLNLRTIDDRFDSNCGLMDQVRALEFVQDNISAFGGDPNNVTLFGQSAGGACILALMTMPQAEPLFHKSIVMSACVDHFFTEEESKKYTELYLKGLEIDKGDLGQLHSLPQDQVIKANDAYAKRLFRQMEVRCAFSPVIDGITLVKHPREAVKEARKPLLMGTTLEEANLFTGYLGRIPLFLLAHRLKLSVKKGPESYRERVSHGLTDYIYREPMYDILSGYKGHAWHYTYAYTLPDARERGLGSCHASDVPVLFGQDMAFLRVSDPKSIGVGQEMRSLWGQFAQESCVPWDPDTDYIIK